MQYEVKEMVSFLTGKDRNPNYFKIGITLNLRRKPLSSPLARGQDSPIGPHAYKQNAAWENPKAWGGPVVSEGARTPYPHPPGCRKPQSRVPGWVEGW